MIPAIVSLDLGQVQDPSALAVDCPERRQPTPDARAQYYHAIRELTRWQLGTSYVDLVEDLKKLFAQLPGTAATQEPAERPDRPGVCQTLSGPRDYIPAPPPVNQPPAALQPILLVDQTGVGRAVMDMIRAARLPAKVYGITITSGSEVIQKPGGWNVPKKDLIACMQTALQQKRLHIARELPLAAALKKELSHFKAKITTAGTETYECLQGGTLVTTARGLVPIERVKKGDAVLTRNGYRRVLWSGVTKTVRQLCRVDFGSRTLWGTPDHLVWTQERGWVPMGELTCQFHCIQIPAIAARASTPRLSSGTELSGARPPDMPTSTTGSQRMPCIGPSGSFTTDPFPMDTTSITRTATRATTTSATWSASQNRSTPADTIRAARRSGVSVQRAASVSCAAASVTPTATIPGNASALNPALSEAGSNALSCALNAASPSLPMAAAEGGAFASAEPFAERHTAIAIASCRRSPARDAGGRFDPGTVSLSSVHPAAPPGIVLLTQPEPVYDLVVQDCHEFFANGVLVHNSWRSRDHDDICLAVAMAIWFTERMYRSLKDVFF